MSIDGCVLDWVCWLFDRGSVGLIGSVWIGTDNHRLDGVFDSFTLLA